MVAPWADLPGSYGAVTGALWAEQAQSSLVGQVPTYPLWNRDQRERSAADVARCGVSALNGGISIKAP